MKEQGKITIDMITPSFLIEMDDLNRLWLSWSWLSMIGYETDPKKRALYEKIYEVKQMMCDKGYTFKADQYI